MRKLIIAGNWKMNKDLTEVQEFCKHVAESLPEIELGRVIPLIAPASPFLQEALQIAGSTALKIAAQDVSANDDGAFTGEVSARMLSSLGLQFCIVGHSERRQYHGETDAIVAQKMTKLLSRGIIPLVCIGESLSQRESGDTEEVVVRQLNGSLKGLVLHSGQEVIIAYEPVWAIGTGLTATPGQAQEVHALIRSWLREKYGREIAQNVSILYGGSVKKDNLASLLAERDIDGGLIGGASLKAEDFISMVQTGCQA